MVCGGAALAAWAASRSLALSIVSFLCIGAIGVLGMWDIAMDTLSQVIVAVVLCVAIAIPVGIWSSQSDRVQRALRPVLDVMQMMPQFVYLVPVIALFAVGRVPGVIAAAALRCLGGAMQGRLYPRNDDERRALIEGGYDLERVLRTEDLIASDDCFFAATGITDGYLLQGVKYWPDGASTHSMVMRSRSGTVRSIESEHSFEKLERFSPIQYRP